MSDADPLTAPSVVLLARSTQTLPQQAPWPQAQLTPTVTVWCGSSVQPVQPVQQPSWLSADAVTEVVARRGRPQLRGRPQAAAARLRSNLLAGRGSVSPDYLWALKSDRALALAVRGSDLVLSADGETDRALQISPDLARGVPVLDSSHADPTGPVWVELRRWCAAVESLAATQDWAEQMLSVLECLEEPGSVRPPAALLGLLTREIELAGVRGAQRPPRSEATVLLAALRVLLRRAGRPDLLDAATAYVDLWEGRCLLGEAELAALVRGATSGADQAWAAADRALALHRLQTAFGVALHRARHCEALQSPLVDRPEELLAPIWASTTYAALRDTTAQRPALARGRRPDTASVGPMVPQVTVLPGAYGAFHHDLVAALEGPAQVRVAKLAAHPLLQRRVLTGADLQLLDALRRGEVDVLRERWSTAPAGLDPTEALAALRSLALHLRRRDVVIGEWFDASTMWASHLVPRDTRMVVRAHGLDILDPWVHLVDWRGIDTVLATTPALGELLHDLTRAAGAPAPVQVLPYRPDLGEPAPQRDPELRFTLGMVGWGRQVKDPHFALDLLERDERRRLVLIGAGFSGDLPGAIQPYADSLHQRLSDPALAARVEIVGRTRDVPAHLAKVGIILSVSRREGWHLGLSEGAASGAVPVVRNWPLLASRDAARSTHPAEWVVEDLEEADRRISELADPETWAQESRRARESVLQRYAPGPVARTYRRLILTPPDAEERSSVVST